MPAGTAFVERLQAQLRQKDGEIEMLQVNFNFDFYFHPSIHLSIHLFIIHLFTNHPSIHPSIHRPSVRSSIYPTLLSCVPLSLYWLPPLSNLHASVSWPLMRCSSHYLHSVWVYRLILLYKLREARMEFSYNYFLLLHFCFVFVVVVFCTGGCCFSSEDAWRVNRGTDSINK